MKPVDPHMTAAIALSAVDLDRVLAWYAASDTPEDEDEDAADYSLAERLRAARRTWG